MAPSRPIEGVVVDVDTKEPIPGAVVTLGQLAGSTLSLEGLISTTTDARGHYRLDGVPRANGHKLSVYPPLDRPYFHRRFLEVAAGAGLEPIRFEVALKRAVWITGKVVDSRTNHAVQASVNYVPMLTNVNAKAYPNFDPSGTSFEVVSRYRTDHEGRYRLVGLPGRGVITVRADERGYRTGVVRQALAGPAYTNQLDTYSHLWAAEFHALKQVDVAKGAEETRCDLALDPGGSVTVVMLDPDGKPLTDLVVDGRFPQGVDVGDMGVHESNVTRVAGLEPDETRRVVFKHDDLRLGAVLVLRPGEWKDGAEITLKLRPYATIIGRLVDANGKPARGGVEVRLPTSDPRVYGNINMNPVAADSEGRFRCEDIPPGGEFIVTATGRPISVGAKTTPAVFESFDLARNLKAEPGQVIDLGTFDAETGKRIEGAGGAKR